MQLKEVSTSKYVLEAVGFFKMVKVIKQEDITETERETKAVNSFCMKKKEASVSAALNRGVK